MTNIQTIKTKWYELNGKLSLAVLQTAIETNDVVWLLNGIVYSEFEANYIFDSMKEK
jgi:hypothetical protein